MVSIWSLILRASRGFTSRGRNFYYRRLGVNIRGYVWMRDIEIPRNWPDITLEAHVQLDRGVVLLCSGPPKKEKLRIASGTYVNRYTIFDAHEHISVGADCLIGPHCLITDGNHGTRPGDSVRTAPMETAPVNIADAVWIGAGAIILPGVTIGAGAVVGAGSVVTRDVMSGAVVAGVPARLLHHRVELV